MSEIRSPYPAELRECMIAPVRVGIRTDLTIYPPLLLGCVFAAPTHARWHVGLSFLATIFLYFRINGYYRHYGWSTILYFNPIR